MSQVFFEIDMSDIEPGIDRMSRRQLDGLRRGLLEAGEELMRLSLKEVPHDTGFLQQTGDVDDSGLRSSKPEVIVGFNTPYAARLHEHPEYRFQKGRKGKYLEDPMKRNARTFREHIIRKVSESI